VNTRSLRFRLVTWYAFWLLTAFIGTGALLYLGLSRYLEKSLATSQTLRAQRIVTLLAHNGTILQESAHLAQEITTSFAPEASGRFIRITGERGNILYQSASPKDLSFDAGKISPPVLKTGSRKEHLPDGTALIISTVRSGPPASPGWFVETGESLAPALVELHRLLVSLGIGFAILGGVAIAGGILLVRRALRPIEKITQSAEGITSRNLSERLPVPATGDEVEHLSQTLNRMITRLDEAFQHNGRFLADASHELRTPLTILQGELESMVQIPGLDSDSRASIGNLLEEVERLARIVESLFALSRLDAGEAPGPHGIFDFAKLAATTAEQMCLLAEDKGLRLSCETNEPVFVSGDSFRLKQVIVNLLDNAIKYTPSGGSVRLRVLAEGTQAICEVVDNGIGIPPEAIPHVFDRFFRVEKTRSRELGGAGIGLSIVKAICTAHGASVEVESREGKGSCFRVRLPLAQAPVTSISEHYAK